MIEKLRDYHVKLSVDGEVHTFVTLARSPTTARLEAIRKARRLLESDDIQIVEIVPVQYKPIA